MEESVEVRRRFSPKVCFVAFYFVALACYLIYGFQPISAADSGDKSGLSIPSISLNSDVTGLELNNHELETPDTIVGSYSRNDHRTLLIGHSTTVFTKLKDVKLNDEIVYDGVTYKVGMIEMLPKSQISMRKILNGDGRDSIVVMTCAGKLLEHGDATHRLMITAVRV